MLSSVEIKYQLGQNEPTDAGNRRKGECLSGEWQRINLKTGGIVLEVVRMEGVNCKKND
jgi:hypothetical protein